MEEAEGGGGGGGGGGGFSGEFKREQSIFAVVYKNLICSCVSFLYFRLDQLIQFINTVSPSKLTSM